MNITAFDLNLLVVFDALLTDGSVTQAARRVGLSQPAFSNALGRLRAAVGDPLFQRTRRGMAPTPRALAMAAPVRASLDELQRALTPPPDLAVASRVVTVAANQYARCLVIPNALRMLMRRAPVVRLDVRDVPNSSAADCQSIDLTLDWSSPGPDRSDSASVVLRDSLVGVARRTNGAVGRAPYGIVLDKLHRIRVGGDMSFRELAFDAFSHMTSDALSALCVVSQTDAVAVVPRRLARRFAAPLGLTTFRLSQRLPDVALQVASSGVTGDSAAAMVRGCLIDAAQKLARGR
ncbi:MAG TPA: LysR family transcriptional regulator [Vicinamibacterales bacterium]|nr:LysR family transcriptional regulator [Vicinamibacterales bacterium]